MTERDEEEGGANAMGESEDVMLGERKAVGCVSPLG
jgi:hypothetical protein